MAIIKCKMCGGDLALIEGQSVAECEYCGSRQTVPSADNEKKLTLFARANRLRANCEFDKAAGIYEAIVADFPEEAEAYWGLVLCKYGIEYVDDPATGKKIPTCHRSSFDSVMEDPDFQQALENADSAARRVYREEAKQIEELRKGIIAVSVNEAPYDIFICYKEADEQGNRTLDSVLAQDIYDALTEKGYRTFFARISLEDKLGQEYEPYIFAALNSARIMLAVGTDYEYYNAVWVKNEWSRFLKLMTKDKTKHLIPCYKGIDAYDMPLEFTKLQAQDLGKLGAVQDILRGVEKLLPRQKQTETAVYPEKSFGMEGSVSSKIAGMLDRGFLALEDQEWEQADSFFEEVLNHDARNSQGYIGKVLAEEQCSSMQAFLEKRKAQYIHAEPETVALGADPQHIAEAVGKFRIPGYVEEEQIRSLYNFEYRYTSTLVSLKEQTRQEKAWWENHKLLSRAEKFAAGEDAQRLRREKAVLFGWFSERIAAAKAAEAQAQRNIQTRYEQDLDAADKKAESLHNEAAKQREQDYNDLLTRKEAAATEEEFFRLYKSFTALEDYADSPALAAECRSKSPGIKESRLKEITLDYLKNRKAVIALAAIAAAAAIWAGCSLPGFIVETVLKQMQNKDAAESAVETTFVAETEAFIQETAAANSQETTVPLDPQAAAYAEAEQLLSDGETAKAAIAFGKLAGYEDARQRSFAIWETIVYRETIPTNWTKQDNRWDKVFVAVRNDGTVASAFPPIDSAVSEWSDIVAIECSSYPSGAFVIGLKKDGTVVTAQTNDSIELDTSEWRDIVAIDSKDGVAVGLKADGTAVATGMDNYGQCNVKDWVDIISVYTTGSCTLGLRVDGTVAACGSGATSVSEWKDIASIDATGFAVGIKNNGTVVTTDPDSTNRYDTSTWNHIVSVDTTNWAGNMVGLKSDGTVVSATTEGNYHRSFVVEWTDIIAVYTTQNYTIGLKADGTVVSMGLNIDGCLNVADWTDIIAIRVWYGCTVGLKSDGTVVFAGKGHRAMQDWENIRFPSNISLSERKVPNDSNMSKGIVTNTMNLNIRSEASTDSKVIGQYKKGDEVSILRESGNWGLTEKGWVLLAYVELK